MPGNVSFVAVTPQPDGTDVRTSFPVSLACAAQCAAVQRMLDGSLGSSSLGAFSFGQAGGQQAGGQQAGGQQAGGQQAGGQAGGGQKVVEGDISLSEEEEDEEEGGMSGGDSDSDSDYRVDDRAGTAKSGSSASGSSASGSGASIGDSDFAAAKKIKTEPSSADSSADSSTDSSAESSFKEQVVAEQQGDKEFMVRGSTESVRAAAQFVNNIDKYASPVLPVTFPVKLSSEPSAKDPSQPLTGGVFVEPFFNALTASFNLTQLADLATAAESLECDKLIEFTAIRIAQWCAANECVVPETSASSHTEAVLDLVRSCPFFVESSKD